MRMGIMGYNQGKSPSTAPYRVVRLRDPTKHDCTHMILYMYVQTHTKKSNARNVPASEIK